LILEQIFTTKFFVVKILIIFWYCTAKTLKEIQDQKREKVLETNENLYFI